MTFSRKDFGDDFFFGAATSSYQVEGAYNVGGKSMSNWDVWCQARPEKVSGGANGCVATDHYHKYKDDALLMKKLGFNAYRLSISWSRILPGGRLSGGVSRDGVQFYNDLIDFIIAQGIEPFVTLFHFEVPQCLELEYGGFLSNQIVQDFVEFAEVCFFEFGDRVKHWITLNEPTTFSMMGYTFTKYPPGHGILIPPNKNSIWTIRHRLTQNENSLYPDAKLTAEPFIVAHNLLSSHAKAVEIYKKDYQKVQGGMIGLTTASGWFYPYNQNVPEDEDACKTAVEFSWGWIVGPLVTGDYPKELRDRLGNLLPIFSEPISNLLKGSYDFIGINYYSSYYAKYKHRPENYKPETLADYLEFESSEHDVDGNLIGDKAANGWVYNVPQGLQNLLVHAKQNCGNPLIYITENGWADKNDSTLTITEALVDKERIKYHSGHLEVVKKAKEPNGGGVNVKGYFVWSLLDNFEWADGYSYRFGMIYVDFLNDLARYPKSSAIWFMNFLNTKQESSKRQIGEPEENYSTTKRIRSR